MTTFIDLDSDRVVGIHIEGEVTDQEFDAMTALIEERMQEYPKIRLYTELESYEGMSLESYFKDFKMGIKHWDRFEKSAVVTEKEWIENMASVADKLVPGVEMRAFGFDEKESAREWVRQ